jgi:glycosyltransferase involved in cell wall biosynthesis
LTVPVPGSIIVLPARGAGGAFIAVRIAMLVSVIVPLYNEEPNVEDLHRQLSDALSGASFDGELLLLDDGSTDGTLRALLEIRGRDPRVRVVKFKRNFGQTAAMRAGIELARGSVLVTMDGDLQNDPMDIPRLVRAIEEGHDIAVGWRIRRKDRFLSRKIPSRIANSLIRKVTGVRVHDAGCSLKAYRASVIKRIPLYSEMHRFIPALSVLAGARLVEVPVNHRPRIRGESKYGLSRVPRVILDLIAIVAIVSFSARPRHLFLNLAMLPSILFLFLSAVALYRYLIVPHDGSMVIPGICVLLGYLSIHLILTGLFAELIVATGTAGIEKAATSDGTP